MSSVLERQEVEVSYKPIRRGNAYAPYWQDDYAEPILVRYASGPEANYYNVILPDGSTREVHCHHLGVFH